MDWPRILGANILRLRKKRGMTQEDVAGEAELDLGYFRAIEKGQRNPSLKKMANIAAALRVKLPELFAPIE